MSLLLLAWKAATLGLLLWTSRCGAVECRERHAANGLNRAGCRAAGDVIMVVCRSRDDRAIDAMLRDAVLSTAGVLAEV